MTAVETSAGQLSNQQLNTLMQYTLAPRGEAVAARAAGTSSPTAGRRASNHAHPQFV